MNDKNPKSLILEALVNHPEGLTMVSLAGVVGLHRHTTTKYLYELIGAGLVYQRKVGSARLCYLKETIEEEQKEMPVLEAQEIVLETQEKKWFGGKSQIRFIAIFLLLGIILISTSVIASNFLNETFGNGSKPGELILVSTKNITSDTPSQQIANVENIPNASTEENNINVHSINNETSETLDTSKSETSNASFPTEIVETPKLANNTENTTESNEKSETRDTDVSENVNDTYPVEIPSIEAEKLIVNIKIEYPKKITRGDTVIIKAIIENNGSSVVNKIIHTWILPEGFEIVSEKEDCENLDKNSSCTSEITVQISPSVEVGPDKIKIVVNYGT